ncbi:hypothetical protein RJ639_036680 [Escallonia herrerae]|uniref:MORF/ORRM1/DAG-like MORF domain-containing protein n=1 Tax=Escallonia herrerae TaxID=1293975 RepID=A0AA88WNL0_9ASTE|nr:hypothetical protein RJ639_036680 [Escallonia herrerae]
MVAFTRLLARHLNVASAPGIPIYYRFTPLVSRIRRLFSNSSSASTRGSELTRAATAVDGCDYRHWLVVMEPPEGHPQRDEIVHNYYIKTLAMALGRYKYFAVACGICTAKRKQRNPFTLFLPREPFIDGDVVPYDDKYHVD